MLLRQPRHSAGSRSGYFPVKSSDVSLLSLPNPRQRVRRIASKALAALQTPIPRERIAETVRQASDHHALREALVNLIDPARPRLAEVDSVRAALRMCGYIGFIEARHPCRERVDPISRGAIVGRLKRLHGIAANDGAVDFILNSSVHAAHEFVLTGLAQFDQLQEVLDDADEHEDADYSSWQAHFAARPQTGLLPALSFELLVLPVFLLTYLQGRYRGFATLADGFPYWQYRHGRTCKGGHGIPDGSIAAVGDPVWKRCLPPHASWCDCRIVPTTRKPDGPGFGPLATPPRPCPLYAHDKREEPGPFLEQAIRGYRAECRAECRGSDTHAAASLRPHPTAPII